MARNEKESADANQVSTILRMQSSIDPEIERYIASLKSRIGKRSVALKQGRKLIDDAMGNTTLTELLSDVRESSI